MPSFPKTPKIQYNGGTSTFVFSQSAVGISTDREYIGGSSESGAGIPENYLIQERGTLSMTWRIMESELMSFLAMMNWILGAGSLGYFTFWPDQSVTGTNFVVYLTNPKLNGQNKLGLKRTDGFQRCYELAVEMRATNNGDFDIQL